MMVCYNCYCVYTFVRKFYLEGDGKYLFIERTEEVDTKVCE